MPDAFEKPDARSAQIQKRFLRWTKWLLLLNLAAAGIGAAGLAGDRGRQAAGVATALFAIGFFLAARLAHENPKRRWYDLRAAAESAKTIAVQYGVGGGPFGIDNPDSDQEYRTAIESIPAALPRLPPLGPLGDPVTPELQEMRRHDLVDRRETYLRDRVEDQRRWYASKAEMNDETADRWRNVMFFGQAGGIAGGIVMVLGFLEVNLLGLAAALVAAAAAWTRTKDYEGLAEAYKVTERELTHVAAEGRGVTTEVDWATYVADAEAAFSREHTLWLARRGVQT